MADLTDLRPRFRLIALGIPRLESSDANLALRQSVGPGKALALITFLAFAPRRTASRDTLCDLLWGDRPVDQARTQLRQTLWLIKTQIDAALLTAHAEGIALSANLTSDADDFLAAIQANDLKRALDLYSGDFFTGYAAPGAGRFEEWASLERTRFRALFIHAAESLARRALDSGRFADAITLARRLRTIDPNGQTGWRLLLEARVAAGDSIGARADAEQFEEWLRQEEWDPEEASRAALQSARSAVEPAESVSGSNALVAELVGREREFAAIHDAWTASRTKGARFAHIVAESGLGKTRLTRDIVARIRAERGTARYLRANYGERHIPFSFAAAVAEALAAVPGASGIAAAAARTLVALNPSLSTTYSESSNVTEGLEALRVGLALLELISAVADEEPIAIALDDMHWCDPESREALNVIASRLRKENVLLITTARPKYGTGTLREDSAEFRLSRLSPAEVGELVTTLARLPEASWARDLPERVWTASGGNPLYALDTIRFCLDTGLLTRIDEEWACPDAKALSRALDQKTTIDRRLLNLSTSEESILLLLGTAGMPTPREIITDAASLRAGETEDVAARLEVRGWLVSENENWDLAHDSIGEGLLGHIEKPEVAREAHARLGTAMASSHDPRWNRRAILHLAAGEQWGKVSECALPLLRNSARSSAEVDTQLADLLGPTATAATVVRVKQQLPLRIRNPAFMRLGVPLALLLLLGIGIVPFSKFGKEPRSSGSTLVVLSQNPRGIDQEHANLDLDHWDPTSPLRFGSPATGREFAELYSGSDVTPRPGSQSWAIGSVYPDSGQGDIDLIEQDGKRTRLTRAPGHDRPVSFSPDGKQLLFVTTRWSPKGWSDVAVMDMATRAVRQLTDGNGTHQSARWSPDGTRIAFSRYLVNPSGQEICTSDVNGLHQRCNVIPNWRVEHQAGWLDEHRLLVEADSSDLESVWLLYDVDRGIASRSAFPTFSTVSLDPTGTWALTETKDNGPHYVRVSPSSRFDLGRLVTADTIYATKILFASPHLSGSFVDSVAIVRPREPLAPGIPHQLVALGWSRTRHRVPLLTTRWRSLSPSIVSIDSLGVVIAHTTGDAVVELSAGGWRTTRDTLHIHPVPVAVLADENWDPLAFERWRGFGDPKPTIVNDGTIRTFYNNGDGNFFSGAYLRNAFDPRQGLAMDIELSTRVTRPQWQVVLAGIDAFRDAETIKHWDHKTGYIGGFLVGMPCWFSYPAGEGEAATRPEWFPNLKEAMGDSSYLLVTGMWYRVRLQIFPDGRCGKAINGHAIKIEQGHGPETHGLRPIIEGSSVATRILVGRVVLRSGVPTDVDWKPLRFNGSAWVPR